MNLGELQEYQREIDWDKAHLSEIFNYFDRVREVLDKILTEQEDNVNERRIEETT